MDPDFANRGHGCESSCKEKGGGEGR